MSNDAKTETDEKARLVAVTLDEQSIARIDPKIDHERQVAIFDILENNVFNLREFPDRGPFNLHLKLEDKTLTFVVSTENNEDLAYHDLSLVPFRRILRDYFLILESYYKAVSESQPAKIEAIDMGRRGLHDEGSQLLQDRLAENIDIDFQTARRLFTLLAALHWKG